MNTLLAALQKLFPDSSNSTLRSWIKQGRVLVDGVEATRTDQEVYADQKVTLAQLHKKLPHGLSILYEDRDLIAIEKPTGLLSVATAFETTLTAHALLKQHYKPRLVEVIHRLDQETSGVMIFALSKNAKDKLKTMFEKHALERLYVAVVEGAVKDVQGTWQSYLVEDNLYKVHSTLDSVVGQQAITHYRCIKSNTRYSWLELTLETGKKNQIRVHCQDAGHPVVGDKKYGSSCDPIKRVCLHSHRLSMEHPITGKPMVFISPVPAPFYSLIDPGKSRAS